MTYLVTNPFTGEQFEIENLNDATSKLEEIKTAILLQEDYRFTVAKEVVNGNNTTWTNADLENDPENNDYHVFNTFTGQHEVFNTLSSTKARRLELKEQFANELGLNGPPQEKVVLSQPISRGSQTI